VCLQYLACVRLCGFAAVRNPPRLHPDVVLSCPALPWLPMLRRPRGTVAWQTRRCPLRSTGAVTVRIGKWIMLLCDYIASLRRGSVRASDLQWLWLSLCEHACLLRKGRHDARSARKRSSTTTSDKLRQSFIFIFSSFFLHICCSSSSIYI
jgi:hypothetical protein